MSSHSPKKLRRSTRQRKINSLSTNLITTTTTNKPIKSQNNRTNQRKNKRNLDKIEKTEEEIDEIRTKAKQNIRTWFLRRETQRSDIDIVAAWCSEKENYQSWRNRDIKKNLIGELISKVLIKYGHPNRTPKDCEGAIEHLEYFFESAYRALNEKGRRISTPKERETMLKNVKLSFPWYEKLEPVMSDRPIHQPTDPHDITLIRDNCLAWLIRLERQNDDLNPEKRSKTKPIPRNRISEQDQPGKDLNLPVISDDGLARSATWSSINEEEEEGLGSESDCSGSSYSPRRSDCKLTKKRKRTKTTSIGSATKETINWKEIVEKYLSTKLGRVETDMKAIEITTQRLKDVMLVINRFIQTQKDSKEEYFKKLKQEFEDKIQLVRSKMIVELIESGFEKEKAIEIARKSLDHLK
ncbi:hypothetical protein DFH28DRAFT_10666 [Melampsora americana]|nr:hypothetical protein DFH28DRAFT_10666 [Melampsora americana]